MSMMNAFCIGNEGKSHLVTYCDDLKNIIFHPDNNEIIFQSWDMHESRWSENDEIIKFNDLRRVSRDENWKNIAASHKKSTHFPAIFHCYKVFFIKFLKLFLVKKYLKIKEKKCIFLQNWTKGINLHRNK